MLQKKALIRNRVQECITLAEQKFCIIMPEVDVRFDLRGKAAGVAGWRGHEYYLRFNNKHMALGGKTWDHIINDVVPHEVAHTVCQSNPHLGRNHNNGWKTVCLALGGNGKRCYSTEDAPEAVAAAEPYVYITTKGFEVRFSKRLHNKIQKGAAYRIRGGKGEVNVECAYNYMAAPSITKIKTVAPTAPTKGQSKADQIRTQIALGNTKEECIEFGVTVLGMKRALAKTYVNNNWNK